MKQLACLCLLTLTTLALGASASAQHQPALAGAGQEVLTNESLIALSKARFKEHTIISLIRSSPTAFDLSTAKLIELKQRGVSERVVVEMIRRQSRQFAPRDDGFFAGEGEEFFNSAPTFQKEPGDKVTNPGEAPVFTSRSDSGSETRTRGPGSNDDRRGESELAGTATVSIVRPPTKEGVPKLERAPKLDNQAIIALIEAGFTEGTILRKIETMQVEFDTSSKALARLRRNRVSERIIKAMTEAMSEGQK